MTSESEYASDLVYIPKNRKKILLLAGLLVTALLIGAVHPVRAEDAYICLGGMCDVVTATNGPWTLSISPSNATNVLPGDPDRIFTISLSHNIDKNQEPQQSCAHKIINVSTTLGTFVESGLPYLDVDTDSTCTFSVTLTSNQTGDAVITAKKGQPPGVEVSAQQHWIGYTAEPSFLAQVDSDPLVMEEAAATFSIILYNTGNVSLSNPTVMVGDEAATYESGDENENSIFDPIEEWQYTFSTPIDWVENGSTTFAVETSAAYGSDRLYQNTSVTYRDLLIGKQIAVEKFREAYQETAFNVSARMDGYSTVYGPFTIGVQAPAHIAVINYIWTFTEEPTVVEDPYPGILAPMVETLTYEPGDSGTLYFENTLEYLQILKNLSLTEHAVEMDLDAGEFDHVLTAIATDQYDEPYPYLEVTFADGLPVADHEAVTVLTSEFGVAENTYSSTLPGQQIIHAFVDADHDTYFDSDEIGDSCILTWSYTPLPENLAVQGDTDVTNYLDYGQFDHTFTLTLTDQYGFPMNNTRINYTIDYENGTDVSSFGMTSADGTIHIAVASLVPDVARITADVGPVSTSMTKTWTYEIAPTVLTFTKTARDVNGGMLVVGDTIEYTLQVRNIGVNPAYFVEVVDNLPDQVTCQDVNGDSAVCADPYIWTIGQIGPGTEISLTINVTINPEAAGQSIINTATIEGKNFPFIEPLLVCPDGSAPIGDVCAVRPVPVTTLSFSKTAADRNGGSLFIGDVITYTLTVTNTGSAPAYDVVVTDDLPDNVTCLMVGNDADSCHDPLIWGLDTLDPGASAVLTIDVSINEDAVGQSIVNTGQVAAGNVNPVDPVEVCPDGSAPVEGICLNAPVPPELPSTTLSFTKSAEDMNGGMLMTGDWIRYVLVVSNTGTTPAYNVVVTDNLPLLLSCQDVQGDSAGCAPSILWYIGTVEPGATATLTINTTILPEAAGQSIINVGLVSGQNFPPIEPPQVCPDGTSPEDGVCAQVPVQPETGPETPISSSTGRISSGSHSFIRASPKIPISVNCGPGEHYLEGRGCILCVEDEVFMEGEGCIKNVTPQVFPEPPVIPSTTLFGRLISLLTYPLLILLLLALLAVLVAVWWERRHREGPSVPGPLAGEIGGTSAADAAYASIIRIINEIDGQLATLERGIRTAGLLSSQEAARAVESFFYTSQLAEGVLKDPKVRQYLTAQQVVHLQAQLEISVQKMHALSRQSEYLLNAMQMQYAQAPV